MMILRLSSLLLDISDVYAQKPGSHEPLSRNLVLRNLSTGNCTCTNNKFVSLGSVSVVPMYFLLFSLLLLG